MDNLLKVKVSKLFYHNQLSKIEIADKLRISRFKVAKILEEAVSEGIVNIIINEPADSYMDLESALEEKFRIFRAAVVGTSPDYEETRKKIGKAAAEVFIEMLDNNDTIGIAWGNTIFEMIETLKPVRDKKNLAVVQLTGGLNQVSMNINAMELTRRIANRLNCRSYPLYAPAIVDNEETKKILMSESNIIKTIEMFKMINIAIVGIGSVVPEPSTMLYKDGFINKKDFEEIINGEAVGDINSYFYNKDGEKSEISLEKKVIGISLEQLKRVRYTIGVAGGKFKADAIHGALKGKIVNIIVTDSETAKEVLNK